MKALRRSLGDVFADDEVEVELVVMIVAIEDQLQTIDVAE